MEFSGKIKAFIEERQLLKNGSKVVVGISGGADSVCLLLTLAELGHKVVAAHCNFMLRGVESERDELFVRELCERHGVELRVERFDTRTWAQEHGLSIEMAARELRYSWFETLRRETGAEAVAVAHHKDDQVETMLLNLVRGTGLRGLCGMTPISDNHIVRPFLCVSHEEILDRMKELGETFVTDSTNAETLFLRNKLRLQVLPLLREMNPAADENILRTMENLDEASKMYRYCVEEFAGASLDGPSELSVEMVLRAPSPLSVLHEVLAPLGFNRATLKDVLRGIRNVGGTYYSPTHRLCVEREQLVISSINEGDCPKKELLTEVTDYVPGMDLRATDCKAYLDADKVKGKLTIRHAQQGDRFVPFGMKGSKLVSDLLCDQKASHAEKEKQLVVLDGDTIAWVVGRRTSELFRIDDTTTHILKITIN